MDISTTPNVRDLYSSQSLRSLMPKRPLKKQEQSTSYCYPLAICSTTHLHRLFHQPSTPSPQPTAQSPNDALMATMTQIANLLSGFQKQVSSTNNQLRLLLTQELMIRLKKLIFYNSMQRRGHVARQCKEPKRKMDSQTLNDQPQALTTTNMFQANHEDAYDSDVDEGPNAAVAFMANLSSTSATNSQVNEVHSNDNQIFDNVDDQIQECHQKNI
ncbi:hypothetical protein Tco_1369611 [Tanacetum coccineum]